MKLILLINVKTPTIVGVLTFISRIMTGFGDFNLKFPLILAISVFMRSLNFMLSSVGHEIFFITLEQGSL